MQKFILLFLFFFPNRSFSQTRLIDSLIQLSNTPITDTQKVKLYGDISWELMAVDISKAKLYAEQQLKLANVSKKDWLIAQAESDLGNVLNRLSNFPDALTHYYNALALRQKLNQLVKVAGIYSNIATILMRQNKFQEAIVINFKSLKIFEQINDKGKQALILGNIGNIYYELKQNNQASVYYKKGLQLAKESGNASAEANLLLNIGGVKIEEQKLDSALYYYISCEKILTENQLLYGLGSLYNVMGKVYSKKNEYDKAVDYYNKGLLNRVEFQDEFGIGLSHLNIGEVSIKLNQYDKAISHLEKSLDVFTKMHSLIHLKDCFLYLSEAHENKNDLNKAIEYFKMFYQYSDSVYSKQTSEQIVEMNAKYDTDKKEQENVLLAAKNQLSEESIKRQKTISLFIAIALILASVSAFFIFKGLKHQKKANQIISKQKQVVESKNHIIEEKQKEILDSIHYAKRIQNTLLAHQDFLNENLPENFVLYKPKDIVSGDFYWATRHNDKFYLAICDSTGHGVPGAFMSLLNIGFLSEAINEKNILEPHKVFDYVRKRLLTSISKEEQKDGFDGILLCFNESTKEVTYAAAHNAPVLISNNELVELPKDKMPVGAGEKNDGFKLNTIRAQKGDVLYLYTDGYADQFGGEKGKKFRYKQLNDLLLTNAQTPLIMQKEILDVHFENWRGNLEQVDDVCVIGLKFH